MLDPIYFGERMGRRRGSLDSWIGKLLYPPTNGEGGHTGVSTDPGSTSVCVGVGIFVTSSYSQVISLEPVDGIASNSC